MSELIPYEGVPQLSKEQAEALDLQLCKRTVEWAFGLFKMAAQKGYKHLGFATMEHYCENRFDMSDRTANNWMVRVRVAIEGHGFTVINYLERGNGFPFSGALLPVATSRLIAGLPEDRRKEAWDLLQNGGGALQGVNQQVEEVNRWKNRNGLNPPVVRTRRILEDEEEEEIEWCEKCGKVRAMVGLSLCSTCNEAQTDQENSTIQPGEFTTHVTENFSVPVPSPVSTTGFTVTGNTVERNQFAPPTRPVEAENPISPYRRPMPPAGLMDNGRIVVPAVCVMTTGDPDVMYARCEVPEGVDVTPGALITFSFRRTQM